MTASSRSWALLALLAASVSTLTFAADSAVSKSDSAKPGGDAPVAEKAVTDAQDLIYLAPRQPVIVRFHVHVDGLSMDEFRKAAVKRIFDSLDADHNGVLEGKELDTVPTAQMVSVASRQNGSTDSSAKADRNPADGRVTIEELAEFIRDHAGTPFEVSVPNTANNNQAIFANPYQQTTTLDGTAFLMALDRGGSARLTVKDLAGIDELFRYLDTNDDETISRTEIGSVGNSDGTAPIPANPLAGLTTLMQPIDRVGSRTGLVRKLIQLYDRTSRDPKTRRALKDKKLSPQELGLPPAALAKFDKNHDGALDAAELSAWLANPEPQFEADVVLGWRSLRTKAQVSLRRAPSSAGNEDGIRVRGEGDKVYLDLAQVPVELEAAEAAPRPISRKPTYRQQFKQADRNNNKYLEPDEIQNAGLGAQEFAAMDRDHNQMVFEPEWMAFMELRDWISDNRIVLTLAAASTDPVTQFDTNKDGRLSRDEFAAALAAVKKWDTNGDGRIGADEVPRHYTGAFRIGPGGGRNGRGEVVYMTNSQMTGVKLPNAPAWFVKMDRNRDGQVSFREFLGPLAVFRKLDANHDGFLETSEAGAAGK